MVNVTVNFIVIFQMFPGFPVSELLVVVLSLRDFLTYGEPTAVGQYFVELRDNSHSSLSPVFRPKGWFSLALNSEWRQKQKDQSIVFFVS